MVTATSHSSGITWEDLCNDPNLQDLPYKIETNEQGQVVMSPVAQYHGKFSFRIAKLLEEFLPDGEVSVECAIRTSSGTKVADAAWYSAKRWQRVKDTFDAPIAPQICVEVLSPTNTDAEMKQKRQLYFEAGAEEVWICDSEGNVRFFDESGECETSQRAPNFSKRVEI